jgi:nitrate/nitrite transporter NarK
VVIFGLALGAELDILAYLTSRYFSVASFGMLFGTIGAFIGLAGSTGPVLLNAVYDATQSYELALIGVIPVCLISASLFLLLGPYPEQKKA